MKPFPNPFSVVDGVVEELINAARSGKTLGEITKDLRSEDGEKIAIDPVRIYRGAETFESLRKAAEDYVAKTGFRPRVFLANMGPIPQHKARADFSIDFFRLGGFEVVTNKGFPDVDKAAEAAIGSGAKIVVICSTDKTYPDLVPPLTRKLKEAQPDTTVILAGYPKDHIETFKEAGVDEFIFMNADVVALLTRLQRKEGVIS
jgi:methylmalonyl-CoA mutase